MLKNQKLVIFWMITFVMSIHPSSGKKVTFILEEIPPVGATSSLAAEDRAERIAARQSKNLQKIITFEELQAFKSMDDKQLEQEINKMLPLPQALQIPSNQLYQQVVTAAPQDFEEIFNSSVMMAGDFSLDVFERFFNVSCLNEEILDEYVVWLRSKVVPAITYILNRRVKNIKDSIEQEEANYVLQLQERRNEYDVLVLEQESQIRRIVQSEIATLVIAPVLATIQSRLYESVKFRWISCAAFAGLTITMLNQYSRLIQQATQQKNQNRRFQEIVEQQQAKTKKIKIPEIKVVDELTGKLIRDFFDRCRNFTLFEREKLTKALQENQRRQEALLLEAPEQEKLLDVGLPVQSSSVVTAVRNPVARQLFSVSKAFHNVNKFFQRK